MAAARRVAVGGGGNAALKPMELRQRAISAINKLSDRDTYQIACNELEAVAESLAPELFGTFLACVYETDAAQKSTVRKECVRLLGVMAAAHGGLLAPHLPRMVANLVKRLKDPDSNVRDACVDAVGVMAANVDAACAGNTPFVVFVRPLLDSLGEQNRHLQVGCALCLSKVVDNIAATPPPTVLHRLLPKIVKLLNNQNYAGKAALLAVVGSVAQAGGAASQHVLGMIVPAMRNALRSSDWATRRAASEAFCRFALASRDALVPFRSSCLSSLESCRFDKVKPVRDSIIQTLQAWKNIPESDELLMTPEPSAKENPYGDILLSGSSLPNVSQADSKLISDDKIAASRSPPDSISFRSIKKSSLPESKTNRPLFSRKVQRKVDDWHVEVNVPQRHGKHAAYSEDHESRYKMHMPFKVRGNMGSDITSEALKDSINEPMKIETPRTSDFDTKCVLVDQCSAVKGSIEVHDSERRCANNTAGHAKSFKEVDSHELGQIRKQLAQIESQQSNLLELVKLFMGSSQDTLRSLESRVHGLERTVDELVQDLALSMRRLSSVDGSTATCCKFPGSDFLSSKFRKKNEGKFSEALSLGKFGRPAANRDDMDATERYKGMFGVVNPLADPRGTSRREGLDTISPNDGSKLYHEGVELRNKALDRHCEGSSAKALWKSSKKDEGRDVLLDCRKENSRPFIPGMKRLELRGSSASAWSRVVDILQTGDVNTAFVEVLCSGDDLLLLKLMDHTGVVLEKLKKGTVFAVLQVLMKYLTKQKHLESITPWLKQILDLSTGSGPDYLGLCHGRTESASTLHEISLASAPDPSLNRSVSQIT